MTDAVFTPPAGKDILGHPRGLAYLVFAEAWERFSYYGMQALLVLYLTQYLLLPEHVHAVAGFEQFKGAVAAAYGWLSQTFGLGDGSNELATPIATAAAITGVYSAGVYATPMIGGWIADRFLGRTTTVALGALFMVAGHFLMAFDVAFVDPPFAQSLWASSLDALQSRGWLKPVALVYVEAPVGTEPGVPAGWTLHRESRAGDVRFALYRASRGLPAGAGLG